MGVPMIAMVASTVMSAGSAYMQGRAANEAGKAQQNAAEFNARQLEVNAGQQRASAQRQMIEDVRQKTLAQSRAQAVAAAQGASSLDPSIIDIMGGLENEGRYNAAVTMYEGENAARGLEGDATASRYEGAQARAAGKAAKRAGTMAAIGKLVSGGADIYNKYQGSAALESSGMGKSTVIKQSAGERGLISSARRNVGIRVY